MCGLLESDGTVFINPARYIYIYIYIYIYVDIFIIVFYLPYYCNIRYAVLSFDEMKTHYYPICLL